MFLTCADDASFGPGVHDCRYNFDFTIQFEQLIFAIGPSVIFILLSFCRTAILLRRSVVVDSSTTQRWKYVSFCHLREAAFWPATA